MFEVRAARNRNHALRRGMIISKDVFLGVFGIGDDDIAARHHRIVDVLEAAAAAIDAMKCGHERYTCHARRHECAPCGRSRTRVNDLHAARLDDGRHTLRVAQDRKWIFGVDRELDQLAAGRLKVRLEATAGAGDQSEPPGSADRFGDFNRGPLDSASV